MDLKTWSEVVDTLLDKTQKREVFWTYDNGVYTVQLPNRASIMLRVCFEKN